MYKIFFIAGSIVLLLAGVFLPSWYIALPGLLLLSAFMPMVGLVCGFVLDILFGLSPILPNLFNYPFMLMALVVGFLSLFLRTYLR